MPRLLSVALTQPAVEARTKTETRRLGWWKNDQPLARPGDRLTLCRKVMGRRKGEPLERIVDVRLTSVHREPLNTITDDAVAREGFTAADLQPYVEANRKYRPDPPTGVLADAFVTFYTYEMRCSVDAPVTVIRWEYLDDRVGWPEDQAALL